MERLTIIWQGLYFNSQLPTPRKPYHSFGKDVLSVKGTCRGIARDWVLSRKQTGMFPGLFGIRE